MRNVIALCIALASCGKRAELDAELDQARVQVRRFFDAVVANDCATLGSLVPAAREPAQCRELVHAWHDDLRIELIDLPDVRRDGRDRRAIIVRATVMRRGAQQTMLVRATHEQGVWQLVL